MLRAIIGNASWLGLIQMLNYGVPILTLPVVTRAFGPSVFGSIATVTAYAAYVGLVINYGFNYTGPRTVSLVRDSTATLSERISDILSGQVALAAVASCIFLVVLQFTRLDDAYKTASILILVQTVANALSPQWVFIGLERMRDFAILQLSFRILAAIVIIETIRSPSDIVLYAEINGLSAVCMAAGSFVILRSYGLRWRRPSSGAWISALREATGLFASTISINLYTTANVLIVGYILGPAAAGPFALADRLRQAIGGVLGPITNAIYPFICRISERDPSSEETRTKRLFFVIIVVSSGLISIGLLIFAPFVVHLVGGEAFRQATPVLRLMAPLPFVISLSNIFGIQTMIPLRMDRQLTFVVTAAACLGVASMFLLTSLFGLEGAGLTVLLVECFVTVTMAVILQRRISVMSLFMVWA
jgi:PST family polysaccharide transporter